MGQYLSGQGTFLACCIGRAGNDEVDGDALGGALQVGMQEQDLGVALEGEAVKTQQRDGESGTPQVSGSGGRLGRVGVGKEKIYGSLNTLPFIHSPPL